MLWARVMRGSSSRAKSVTPRAASSALACGRTQRIAQGDDHLPGAESGQIGLARLRIGPGRPDLEQNVGGEGLVAGRDDLGALVGVEPVGETGRLARPALDQHFQPGLGQKGDACRDEGNAFFARERLLSDCNDHNLPKLTRKPTRPARIAGLSQARIVRWESPLVDIVMGRRGSLGTDAKRWSASPTSSFRGFWWVARSTHPTLALRNGSHSNRMLKESCLVSLVSRSISR